ncbi:MAG: hypothetical protein AB1782_06635 [Cyanobacteriota bacterium]
MIDDITFKYLLKTKVQEYNKAQKSLYINTYIFKIVLLLILLVFFLMFTIYFILPLLTPLFLKKSLVNDALVISCSGCLFSILTLGLLVLFFRNRLAKKKKQQTISLDDFETQLTENTNNPNLPEEIAYSESLNLPKKKPSYTTRFLNIIPLSKNLLMLISSEIFSSVPRPKPIYLDNNKIEFALNIYKCIVNTNNYLLYFDDLQKKYPDYSNTWLENTLNVLNILGIFNITFNDTNQKIILLNLEFYNPDTDITQEN